jgi:hypothetical protein
MYPDQVRLHIAPHLKLYFNGEPIEGQVSATVELEAYAGSGDVEITFGVGQRTAMVMMNPDAALTLADAISFYAKASKRIRAHDERVCAEYETGRSATPPADWAPEWDGVGDC